MYGRAGRITAKRGGFRPGQFGNDVAGCHRYLTKQLQRQQDAEAVEIEHVFSKPGANGGRGGKR